MARTYGPHHKYNIGEKVRVKLTGTIQGFSAEVETDLFIFGVYLDSDDQDCFIKYSLTQELPGGGLRGTSKIWTVEEGQLSSGKPIRL